MSKVLQKYLPEGAMPIVVDWFKLYNFHLTISKARKTKLGDFRPSRQGKPARISVNGDLNPFHFAITLTHEIAHYVVWEKYKNSVPPHGKEWKQAFAKLMKELQQFVNFPESVSQALNKHLANPKASSCNDANLYKALKLLDDNASEFLFLDQLKEGDCFTTSNGKRYKKGVKRRSRILCTNLENGKDYLVSAHLEVSPLV